MNETLCYFCIFVVNKTETVTVCYVSISSLVHTMSHVPVVSCCLAARLSIAPPQSLAVQLGITRTKQQAREAKKSDRPKKVGTVPYQFYVCLVEIAGMR